MSTLNNENEHRLTRSRAKLHPATDEAAKEGSLSADPKNQSLLANRQHLKDVSRHFGIAAQPLHVSKKRPLASEMGPVRAPRVKEIKLGKEAPVLDDSKAPARAAARAPATVPAAVPAKTLLPEPAPQAGASVLLSEPLKGLQGPSLDPQHRQSQKRPADSVEPATSAEPHQQHEAAPCVKKSKKPDYEWQDLDEEDFDDPLMVSEYVNEIFPYLHELEKKTCPDSGYLFKQTQLKPKMRLILVDWLVEMHQRFRLLPETLFLAINIMDRFMSVEVVQIDKLQLLATGSLFIAAKYEEVFSPSVKNYAYYTDGLYTEEEILQAEKYILTTLEFDLNYPNPMNFLRRISKADDYDVQSRTLGKFLLEVTIVDHKFIGILPSLCLAAAMYIARMILNKDPVWNGNLVHYSGGYRVDDMRECIELIVLYLVNPVEHDEFFKKYATRKFMKASIVCRSWAKKVVAEGRDLFCPSLSTDKIK